MFNSKNIKMVCSFIIISLFFIIVVFINRRNSSDNETIGAIENNICGKTNSNDVNEGTPIDEINLNNGGNDSIEIKETESNIISDEHKEQEEQEEHEKQEKSEEFERYDDVIGNDLPIEHSPEHSGSFVIINSVGYEKFKFSEYNANVYIESVNKHAENIASDVKIYNLIAPTSSEFNMPDEYRDLSGSQKDGINYAYSKMNDRIITVDAYSNIEANKNEYVYFKTDHHWTALGAYRAYESFMKSKAEEPFPLEKYNRIDSKNKYLGSIYNMTENERLENNLDDIWYYKPLLSVEYSAINRNDTTWDANQIIFPSYFERSGKYAVFMGGDTAFSHIKVDSNIERKILVIKDSYGNAFIPFLLPHYGDIFVADPRYYKDNIYDTIKENKIDELLIINYATVLQLPGFSQMLWDMGTADVTSGTAIGYSENVP